MLFESSLWNKLRKTSNQLHGNVNPVDETLRVCFLYTHMDDFNTFIGSKITLYTVGQLQFKHGNNTHVTQFLFNLFSNKQSRKEVIGQSKEIKQKWKGTKSFDICFSVIFSCHGLYLGGEAFWMPESYIWRGGWALGSASDQPRDFPDIS